VNAYPIGQMHAGKQVLTDTSGPPPEVRITTFIGYPPILDDEWVGDVPHRQDSDQVYFQLYGRFPE
jgi:hypothetical protein